MKDARELVYDDVQTPHDAVRCLLRVRFAECLTLQRALYGRDDEALHAFRLACKRLRYAVERFEDAMPELKGAAALLARMTDELGAAHDCVVLAERAHACGAHLVVARAQRDRDRYVRRSQRSWRRAFRNRGALAPLAARTNFGWQLPTK